MKGKELANDILKRQRSIYFPCYLYGEDGYSDEDEYLDLSDEQVCYLLHQSIGRKDLFDGVKMSEVNVDIILSEMAFESCFPDGLSLRLDELLPKELNDIVNELENADGSYKVEREILKKVKAGYYTFEFTVESDGYSVGSFEAQVKLYKKDALACLEESFYSTVYKSLDIRDEDMYEYIVDLANENNAGAEFAASHYSCGGRCDKLDLYLKARTDYIRMIADGKLSESQVKKCEKQYFDEDLFTEISFKKWLLNNK